MQKKVVVLATHGIGTPKPDFAAGLEADLESRLGTLWRNVTFKPIFWGDVLDAREATLFNRMRSIGARWNDPRQFVIEALADASAYQFVGLEDRVRHEASSYFQIGRDVFKV